MSEQSPAETFVPLHTAALRLGVPAAWLKSEATSGRIPFLRAGKRFLFYVPAVEAALIQRTTPEQQNERAAAHA